MADLGLGHIVALHRRSSTSYQICSHSRAHIVGASVSETTMCPNSRWTHCVEDRRRRLGLRRRAAVQQHLPPQTMAATVGRRRRPPATERPCDRAAPSAADRTPWGLRAASSCVCGGPSDVHRTPIESSLPKNRQITCVIVVSNLNDIIKN
jgi:hypothetical protein